MLAANIESGEELGASLHVTVDGESVVDLWGGWRDREHTVPWTEDTIVCVWSTTKCVTSMAVLMLVDRGQIDVDAPVATYWPEFAQNGKERVLVRHLLGHTAGVSGWEHPFRNSDAFDLAASTDRLARQAPWWEPGTVGGYHATTFGHLNGELVRRVTGKTLGTFIAAEIAGPLHADFYVGLDDSDLGRVAHLVRPVGLEVDRFSKALTPPADRGTLDSPGYKTGISVFGMTGTAGDLESAALANTSEWCRAEIGAANGHGNARGLGRILSAITNGGMSRGRRLLRPETIDLIFDEQFVGEDLFLSSPIKWGIGFALSDANEPPMMPFVRLSSKLCYWVGWGGSFATMDVERSVTITYAMNQLHVRRNADGSGASEGTYDVQSGYSQSIYECVEAYRRTFGTPRG
jgi:CubicO group peptidase (beta-lactamase class C family)